MKKLSLLFTGAIFALSLSVTAYADERPDHFRGKTAETLAEAVANFSEYNEKLSAVLAQGSLEPKDMVKVHELTYTLENALEKIQSELVELAETLEEVHVASEEMEADAVTTHGQKYLEAAREIIQ